MNTLTGHRITCIRGQNPVFSGVSFTVKSGEVLLVRGANGSGKTSLLRMLAGLLQPTDGHIDWNSGAWITNDNAHWLGTDTPLKGTLTVSENIGFWSRLAKATPAAQKHALQIWGLESLADTPVRYLSTGQKRRVNLCRLLLAERPVWLLDEPLTGLDDKNRETFYGLIKSHVNNSGIAVIASHDEGQFPTVKNLQLGAA